MRQQSYLVRKGARYHFRRRLTCDYVCSHAISVSLNTADPAEARRLARRLAVKWDEIAMYAGQVHERGTLTLKEQEALFRSGMEEELAHATRHLTAPIGPEEAPAALHKIMAAAYSVISRVPASADRIGSECIDAEVDGDWTPGELDLLRKVLSLWVTPRTVGDHDARQALLSLGAPANAATAGEARAHLLRGRAEAHRRAALLEEQPVAFSASSVLGLLDDARVAQARGVLNRPAAEALDFASVPSSHPFFAEASNIRFSEQIQELHDAMFEDKGWQPDGGKTLHMLQVFAWLTGDLAMSDYRPKHIKAYAKRLARIPLHFNWGKLGQSGEMAVPFDPQRFKELPPKAQRRQDRTLNSHFSKLEIAAQVLMETYWLPKQGFGQAITFRSRRKTIPTDDANPRRVPLMEENLKTLYGLSLWQGGGGAGRRLKPSASPTIWQDAAYWVPLFGTYMGISREEGCGVEVIDFGFDATTPYMLIRANMTKSKDGETPAGIKRLSRNRALPIHPELLRLGLREYVEAIVAEGHPMIFPELYGELNRDGEYQPFTNRGGKRFYAIAWRFAIDAAHAMVPLPMTSDGKRADFHSQRTFHYSAMASEDVSAALLARHFGHAQTGVGNRNYNRPALTFGQERELADRLRVLLREVPVVTENVPTPPCTRLLPLNNRSRVGSATGRNAALRFLA